MKLQTLESWLSAERRGRDEEAEKALFEVFRRLPVPEPAADFADRVLVRAGIVQPTDLRGVWKLLAITTLVVTSLIASGIAPFLSEWLQATEPKELLAAMTAVVASGIHLMADLWILLSGFGQTLQGMLRVVWVVTSSPQAQAALCLTLGFVFFVSRWLVSLISYHRNPDHAPI